MISERPLSAATILVLGAILLSAIVVYHPVVSFDYTNWDDDIHITNNPAVQTMDKEHAADLFRPTDRYMFHPLTMLSYMLEWRYAPGDPSVPHTVNLCLHLLNIVLVFFVIRSLHRSDGSALFITAVFALHPLQTESVAWISARKDLLSATFALLAFLSYHRWKRERGILPYGWTVVLFMAAILAKPSAVVLPALLAAMDRIRGAWERRSFVLLLPLFFIAFVAAWFHSAIAPAGAVKPFLLYTVPQRIAMIGAELFFYPISFVVPSSLSAFYGYPVLQNGMLPVPVIVTAALAFIGLIVIILRWKQLPWLNAGIVWYIIALLPVLQILPFTNASLTADRYSYLAIIGLLLIITEGWEYSAHRFVVSPVVVGLVAVLIAASLSFDTTQRLPVWRGSIPLFTDVLAHRPDAAVAYGNRANAFVREGSYIAAIADCDRLLELMPGEPKGHYNRGNALLELQRYTEAELDFHAAVAGGFRTAGVFTQRSRCAAAEGRRELQRAFLDTALQIDPLYRDAVIARVAIGFRDGERQRSEHIADVYLRSVPNDPEVLLWSARGQLRNGRIGMALDQIARSVSLRPVFDERQTFIDSVDAAVVWYRDAIVRLTTEIDEGAGNNGRVLLQRAALYDAVGDDIRASRDRKEAQEVRHE